MKLKDNLYKILGGERAIKIVWLLFGILPVNKRKIVCQSFWGMGYSDNPKAIVDEIIRQGLDYKVVWLVKDQSAADTLPSNVKAVKVATIAAVYHMCTAGFWIDNSRKLTYVRKRAKQHYIQTWHGFPIKKIEADVDDKLSSDYVERARLDAALCDLMVSNSAFLTDLYRKSFWYSGEVLECGSPRNDILVNNSTSVDEIKDKLDIPRSKKILLYAPTFRNNRSLKPYDLDCQRLIKKLHSTFGSDWIIAVRLHPHVASKSDQLGLRTDNVVDVSYYADMQELLGCTDALVTDYSSVMFDFMLTEKPCFIYANDVQAYLQDRGFYYDMTTLPFAVAENQKALFNNMSNFKMAAYKAEIGRFMKKFGFVEQGSASRAVVAWVNDHQ